MLRSTIAFVGTTVALLLVLTSCEDRVGEQTLKEIAKTQQDIGTTVTKLDQRFGTLEAAQDKAAKEQKALTQYASDSVDTANHVLAKIPDTAEQRRYVQVVGSELSVAARALPPPSAENQARAEKILQAVIQGQDKQIADLLEANRRLLTEIDQKKTELSKTQEEVVESKAKYLETSNALTTKTNVLAQQTHQLEVAVAQEKDAKIREAQARGSHTRLAVAYLFMAAGGLLIVGSGIAAYLHVPGILMAGVSSGITILLIGIVLTMVDEFLAQTWVKMTLGFGILGVLLAVAAWTWRQMAITRAKACQDAAIAHGTVGAIQEFKEAARAAGTGAYDDLKTRLKEWFTDADGHPDTAIHKEIDRRLVKANLK